MSPCTKPKQLLNLPTKKFMRGEQFPQSCFQLACNKIWYIAVSFARPHLARIPMQILRGSIIVSGAAYTRLDWSVHHLFKCILSVPIIINTYFMQCNLRHLQMWPCPSHLIADVDSTMGSEYNEDWCNQSNTSDNYIKLTDEDA